MVDLNDFLIIVGVILFSVGLWWIYPPIALVVVGAAFVLFGFLTIPKKKG